MSFLTVFENRAHDQPSAPAVRFSEITLTYADLERRSRRIAHALRAEGIERDDVVALSVERSPALVAAVLGVLRAGGACLPLDRNYPTARTRFMLADAQPRLLITDDVSQTVAVDLDVAIRALDDLDAAGHGDALPSHGDDVLAYVLYTSGSTGTPKGVAMPRRCLSNLVAWQMRRDGDLAAAPTAQFAPISFDVSFQEILSTLCAGGTLVLLRDDERRDPERLLDALARHRVARLFLPTAALHPLAEFARTAPQPADLGSIYVAGEQLQITPAIREWLSGMPACRLHNDYGPTETHVVTSHTLDGDPHRWPTLPPIGKPLPGVSIRLLDDELRPVAEGDVGEIYVGGECLARGYLGRPELTEERFLAGVGDEIRLYRTGDLGRVRDGLIECLGRADRQVKIRGFRVEPAEIEAALAQHPDVAAITVVTDRDAVGGHRLVAYVVPRQDHGASAPAEPGHEPAARARWERALAEFLGTRLPDFMVPAVWMTLPRLPVGPTGKIDRDSLPPVPRHRPALTTPLVAPRTTTETQVAALWCEVLQLAEVGVDDSFFDLGGTSLLVAHLHTRLRREFSVDIPVVALFEHPTVRAAARFLDRLAASPRTHGADTHTSTPGAASGRVAPARSQSWADGQIAVVGLACRFPDAADPAAFWLNLRAGVESVMASSAPQRPAADGVVRAGGVLADIDQFDAEFFGYSPREAALLDPQHRLFLECAWEALEDAACDARRHAGRISVFGGCGPSTYLLNVLHPTVDWRPDRTFLDGSGELQLLMATDKDFLTSRVSYKLDLRGPSVNVNAACATSLFAVHYACRSLLSGESDLALAGAASVPVPQFSQYTPEPGLVLSPDGHCRAFDERAAGTVFGSGVGVVALKRLDDALADGDDIYAVIRGSAVNNDGAGKVGMSAPSVDGQAQVITDALRAAGVDPSTLSYVEAHGTGTALGDPIEVAALARAFGSERTGWCTLGSVKTNIGHLGWAAGMAGLIKTVLALRNQQIPATLHFQQASPLLGLDTTPFRVTGQLAAWPPGQPLRRAGVSAFGLGGANAHVVMEEAPPPPPPAPAPARHWHVVALSARTDAALSALAARHAGHLDQVPDLAVADVATTLGTGRAHHEKRLAIVARDVDELRDELHAVARRRPAPEPAGRPGPRPSRLAALFTGQGAEYVGMGRELYDAEPVFRRTLDSFDALLRDEVGATASALLYDDAQSGGGRLASIATAQPLVFAVQVALLRLWGSWGIHPDLAIGHSLGEFAAACAAGVFTAEDGLWLVAQRGRLLRALPDTGGMAAVFADEPTTRSALAAVSADLVISAVNGPLNTTISGLRIEVRRVCEELERRGLQTKELRVTRAGHSWLMDPALDDFEAAAGRIAMRPPHIDLISNVTGALATDEVCTPAYWRRHLRETVRFSAGLDVLRERGAAAMVEIGPGPVLLGLAQAALPDHPGPWVPSLHPKEDSARTMARGLAQLYEAGLDVDWQGYTGGRGRRLHLPVYPFQRQRHWIDGPATVAPPQPSPQANESDGSGWRDWLYRIAWQPVAVPPARPDRAAGDDRGAWLVLADDTGVGQAVADEFVRRGRRCVVATPGEQWHQISDHRFVVDPGSPADLVRLVDSVDVGIGGVVHLWGLDAATSPSADLRPAVTCVLGLTRAFTERCTTPPPLWLATRGAQPVEGHPDPLALGQAPLLGLARVGRLEHPDLHFGTVDLPAGDTVDAGPLADLLLAGHRREPELALRAGAWYAPRLVRDAALAPPPRLRADATYLVTGGLGGLGLAAAQTLVALGARRLVLAGRRAPTAGATPAIAALRGRGVDVVVTQVDVTEPGQVDRLVETAHHGDAPLRGILHCAGVLDDGVLTGLTWDRFAAVLAPKTLGAWYLHTATSTRGLDLDFFVLYSSATSVLGNPGQASHAAANAFLDALAHERRATGLPGLALNWGPWTGAGHLEESPDVLAQLERTGMGALTADAGAQALAHHLASGAAQAAVLPNDWPRYLANRQRPDEPFFQRLGVAASAPRAPADLPTQLRQAAAGDRRAMLDDHIRQAASRLLGTVVSPMAADAGDEPALSICGMDSLTAIQLRNSLQRDLGCNLAPRFAYEHPTVPLMVDHILQVLDGQPAANRSDTDAPPAGADRPGVAALSQGEVQHPLSVQQRRWLSLIREVGYGQRVVPIIFHAPLDPRAIHAALRDVVQRHEVLRSRYPDGRTQVLPAESVVPSVADLLVSVPATGATGRGEAVRAQVRACREGLGDPAARPSWTVRCVELGPDSFAVLLGLQHLEFDGASLSVFTDELREIYHARTSGERPQLAPAVQYREYAQQQHRYADNGRDADRSFFEGLFASVPSTTTLPAHPGFATTQALPSRRFTPDEPAATWARVVDAADVLDVSPFSVILASYARLISRLTTSASVVISMITSARIDPRFAATIGPFTAPFPVPVHVADRSPQELIRQCHRLVSGITARAGYPVTDLPSVVPAFAGFPADTYFTDVGINFTNYRRQDQRHKLRVDVIEILGPVSHPDFSGDEFDELRRIPGLHLVADIVEGGLRTNYWYHADRFRPAEIRAWAAEHRTILTETLAAVSATVAPQAPEVTR